MHRAVTRSRSATSGEIRTPDPRARARARERERERERESRDYPTFLSLAPRSVLSIASSSARTLPTALGIINLDRPVRGWNHALIESHRAPPHVRPRATLFDVRPRDSRENGIITRRARYRYDGSDNMLINDGWRVSYALKHPGESSARRA